MLKGFLLLLKINIPQLHYLLRLLRLPETADFLS